MDPLTVFYIPVPSRAAGLEIVRRVLEERVAACGNLLGPMTSVYEWKGDLCEEEEWVLILKTSGECSNLLTRRVKELHPYECPCIAQWKAGANPDFVTWLKNQTR